MFSLFRKKNVNIVSEGWLHGMTDIHCHLVPGVDDGSKSLSETISILRQMQQMGIERVITTPHIYARYPNNNATSLTTAYTSLLEQLPSNLPPLFLAAEYMIDDAYTQQLSQYPLLTLGKSPYLLTEFSFAAAPFNYNMLIYEVVRHGAIPLLAHPERFLYLSDKEYDRLKEQGSCFQLNLFSLTEMYGEAVQKRAHELFKRGMYDFVGTDTHKPDALQRIADSAYLPPKMEQPVRDLIARNNLLFT